MFYQYKGDPATFHDWVTISYAGKMNKEIFKMIGEVIGTKNQKTIKVRVEKIKMHPLVNKPVIRHKNYQVHDSLETCVVGDIVSIKPCPKISKTKTFQLHEVVTPAKRYTDPETGKLYSQKAEYPRRDRASDYGAELFSGTFYPSKE